MRRWPRHNLFKLLITIALSVAIIGIGFGHRAPNIQNDVAVKAYILNGGSIWDICGDPSDTSDYTHKSCEACRLVETTKLTAQICLPERQNLHASKLLQTQVPSQRHTLSLQSTNFARAPPITL